MPLLFTSSTIHEGPLSPIAPMLYELSVGFSGRELVICGAWKRLRVDIGACQAFQLASSACSLTTTSTIVHCLSARHRILFFYLHLHYILRTSIYFFIAYLIFQIFDHRPAFGCISNLSCFLSLVIGSGEHVWSRTMLGLSWRV